MMTKNPTKKKIIDRAFFLRKNLEKWNREYFILQNPSVPDEVYDSALEELIAIEKKYFYYFSSEELKSSPTLKVGNYDKNKFSKVKHEVPMLSLNKAYSLEDLQKYEKKILEIALPKDISYYLEPKIDGLSISLTYLDGKLVRGTTRGDGEIGEDVTENILQINNIPLFIGYKKKLEVRGEAYMSNFTFEKLNSEFEKQNLKKFANPRNATSGTLRSLDSLEVKKREIYAFLYWAKTYEEEIFQTQEELIIFLKKLNFPVNPLAKKALNIEQVYDEIQKFASVKDNLDYEVDGMVVKLNQFRFYEELGNTAKFPRSQIAYKYREKINLTTLKNIFGTVGRTGIITYNAELKPVFLNGTLVSKATLHNYNYIKSLNLNIGDDVLIKKAGEIIPKVIKVAQKKSLGVFPKIDFCPGCQSELITIDNLVDQYCFNESCPEIMVSKIVHFCSKKAMDIKNMGEKNIRFFYDKKYITKIEDIYFLKDKKNQLQQEYGFAEKSIEIILAAIENSKKNLFWKVIFSLGIKNIGEKISKIIAKKVSSFEEFLNYDFCQFLTIKDFGNKIVDSIKEYLKNEENQKTIKKLLSLGIGKKSVNFEKKTKNNFLKNYNFVITGRLNKPRNYYVELIEKYEGKILDSVSKKVNFLIVGQEPGSKFEKAKKLKINTLDENEFENFFKLESEKNGKEMKRNSNW